VVTLVGVTEGLRDRRQIERHHFFDRQGGDTMAEIFRHVAILPYKNWDAGGHDWDMQMNSQIRIDVLLFDGFDELDAIGPYEALRNAFTDVTLTSASGPESIRAAYGAVLQTVRAPAADSDWLIVPGGGWNDRAAQGTWAEVQRGDLPKLIRSAHTGGTRIASVCTGAMLLAAAGLLTGKPATTHAGAIEDLRETGATIVDGARVVDLGDIVTAAGVTSGLDLALWLVERLAGPDVVSQVSTELEYERRSDIWIVDGRNAEGATSASGIRHLTGRSQGGERT
jgi:transcriptional regulator GlxA family with amidase domain